MALKYLHPHMSTTIHDNSVVDHVTLEGTGTSAYVPFFSDRGQDNKVLEFTTASAFIKEMGRPNYHKYGQATYNLLNLLNNGGRVYGIRLLPPNASHAHVNIISRFLNKDDVDNVFVDNPISGSGSSSILWGSVGTSFDPSSFDYPSLPSYGLNGLQVPNQNLDFGDVDFDIFPAVAVEHPNPTQLLVDADTPLNDYSDDVDSVFIMQFYSKGRGRYGNNFSFTMEVVNELRDSFPFVVYSLRFFEKRENGFNQLVEGPYQVSLFPEAVGQIGQSIFIENVVDRFSQNFGVNINRRNLERAYDAAMALPSNEGLSKGEVDILDINGHAQKIALLDIDGDPIVNSAGQRVLAQNILVGEFRRGTDIGLIEVDGAQAIPDERQDVLTSAVKEELLLRAFISDEEELDKAIDRNIIGKRAYPFDTIFDAAYPATVKAAICKFTEVRPDVFAFLDLGYGIASGIEAQNMAQLLRIPRGPNNAIFGQTVKVYDPYTTSTIELTLPYDMAGRIAGHDRAFGIQFPIAGNNRGIVEGYDSISFNPLPIEKEELYRSRINYIETDYRASRYMTQLTSQLQLSALSNINNVRVLGNMVRTTEEVSEGYFFESATPETLTSFQSSINGQLSKWVTNGACQYINAFVEQTPYDVEQRIVRVRIELAFTNVIERIAIEFNVGK